MKVSYDTHVKPYLEDVTEMALTMTEKQIAKTLNIGCSTFYRYKTEHKELVEALKKGRRELVKELKSTLIQKAKGFSYEERKVYKEDDVVVKEEIMIKRALPDVAALNLLLKNYDRDWWRNDPAEYELKKKQLELNERKVEQNEW